MLVTYSLSKRGVIVEVRKRAAEWGARGARIVSVSPGLVVDTAIGQAAATITPAPTRSSPRSAARGCRRTSPA